MEGRASQRIQGTRPAILQQIVEVRGRPVRYEVAGSGEAIILIHGLSESTRLWYRNVTVLARHFQVYLIDLPGFGLLSGKHQIRLTEAGLWLEEWMQAVGLTTATLVGHSMGGYVSMALAAARPERVTGLVLVNSIGVPLGQPVARLVPLVLRAILHTAPRSLWLRMSADYLRAGHRMVVQMAQQIVELDASTVIAAIQTPTLLIWGECDDLIPCQHAHLLRAQIPHADLWIMQGANHYCMYERPEEFNQTLLQFLQRNTATRI